MPAEPAPEPASEGCDLVEESESEDNNEEVEFRAPAGAELTDQNVRCYAVWKGNAGQPSRPRVHWSHGPSAY